MVALVLAGLVACGTDTSTAPPADDGPAEHADAPVDVAAPVPPPVDVFVKDVPVPDGDVTVVVPLPAVVVGAGRVEPGAHVDVGATLTVKGKKQTLVTRMHLLVTHVDRDGRTTIAASPDDAAVIEKVLAQGKDPFALLDDGDLRVVYVDDGAIHSVPVAPGDSVAVDVYLGADGGGATARVVDGLPVHDVDGVSVGLSVSPDQGEMVTNASRLGPIVLVPEGRVAPSDPEPTAPSPQKGIIPISPGLPG